MMKTTLKIDLRKNAYRTSACGLVLAATLVAVTPVRADGEADRALSDSKICAAVEDAFYFDRAVPFDNIDASCHDGVVTLEGKAGNLMARLRAARLAETVRGVRSIVNRVSVRPVGDMSKRELGRDVKAAFLAYPATEAYELDVDVTEDGRVTLSGTVQSWQERQLAESVAMGVHGVTEVVNSIAVDTPQERTTDEIKPEIEETLRWDALVDHRMIDVAVDDGKVTLSGFVGSAAEKRRARYDAWVTGVSQVVDADLKVSDIASEPMRRKTAIPAVEEDEIREAITDANMIDPRVMSFKITPSINGSVVTLRGKVDNLKAKHAAAENARNTVGVSWVINRIKVRSDERRKDPAIETDVQNALLRDPFVERYEVAVNVVDGTVYLTGSVDSYFEKAQAEDIASHVGGVVDVSNALVVSATAGPIAYDPYVYDWHVYDYDWYAYEPTFTAKSDKEIAQEINSQLWWSPFVDEEQVSVDVNNGMVTLSGAVDTWAERRAATENAFEGGAIGVDNNLTVQ